MLIQQGFGNIPHFCVGFLDLSAVINTVDYNTLADFLSFWPIQLIYRCFTGYQPPGGIVAENQKWARCEEDDATGSFHEYTLMKENVKKCHF